VNAAQFFDHWNKVWRDLQRATALLKDEHLDFRPSQHYARSVGDILRHIMNLEEGWIHYVVRREHSTWPAERELGTIEELRQALNAVHQETMDYLATIPVEDFNRIIQVPDDGTPKLGWILWHVFEQQVHHRGELFLCLSLLGLERPKTDRPG
jgi:uncharacterized damage-inducible protein DinB